jgi:hypothetical protein
MEQAKIPGDKRRLALQIHTEVVDDILCGAGLSQSCAKLEWCGSTACLRRSEYNGTKWSHEAA